MRYLPTIGARCPKTLLILSAAASERVSPGIEYPKSWLSSPSLAMT
jgi:hypothetical protein